MKRVVRLCRIVDVIRVFAQINWSCVVVVVMWECREERERNVGGMGGRRLVRCRCHGR